MSPSYNTLEYMHSAHAVLFIITATCAGLVGNGMTVFQYDDNMEGSVLTISCLEGYLLPEGDVEFVCTSNGSWSPDPLNYHCEHGKSFFVSPAYI